MKQISQSEIVRDITTHNFIWDISEDFAQKILNENNFKSCKIYSYAHYKTIYLLLKKKLDTLSSKTDKIAYINCLIMNYTSLQNNDATDLAVSLLSGSFLGISFFDTPVDTLFKIFALLILLFFAGIKLFSISNRKWKFYIMILEQIKSDLQ